MYRRHKSRISTTPLCKAIRQIFYLPIGRSFFPRVKLLVHGPEWSTVAKCVSENAYFIDASTTGKPDDRHHSTKSLFFIDGDPRTVYEKETHPRRRIRIFFCQGIRPKIPWIDYMYMRLLKELSETGAKVVILSHNDQFDRDSQGGLRPRHTRSSAEGFAEWTANVEQLFGFGFAEHSPWQGVFSSRPKAYGEIHRVYLR